MRANPFPLHKPEGKLKGILYFTDAPELSPTKKRFWNRLNRRRLQREIQAQLREEERDFELDMKDLLSDMDDYSMDIFEEYDFDYDILPWEKTVQELRGIN